MKIDGDCPHCKGNLTLDTEKLQYSKPEELQNAQPRQITTGNNQILEQKPSIVEKIKEVLPSFMPAGRCANGNCDVGVHKNPNYKKKIKGKCTNCNQFSGHKDGECPWCRKKEAIEEIDEEELEDLGIPNPPDNEHEGHNHE